MIDKDMVVLLVDDFSLARHVLGEGLLSLGITQTLQAANGKEAIDKMTRAQESGRPVSMIICDLNMPNMSGLELLRHTRSQHQYRKIPFIVVTVEGEEDALQELLAAGATDCLVKPMAPKMVAAKIEAILKNLRA